MVKGQVLGADMAGIDNGLHCHQVAAEGNAGERRQRMEGEIIAGMLNAGLADDWRWSEERRLQSRKRQGRPSKGDRREEKLQSARTSRAAPGGVSMLRANRCAHGELE